MALKGADLIIVLMIMSLETEFFIALFFFSVLYNYMFYMMGFTGLAFLLYYLGITVKSLRTIAGHIALSETLFFTDDRWDIDDVLITSVKEYSTPDHVIDQFEQSDAFLQRFNENILKTKMSFPKGVDSLRSKFYYLELKKRISSPDIEELLLNKTKELEIMDILRDKLKELTKKISKNPIADQLTLTRADQEEKPNILTLIENEKPPAVPLTPSLPLPPVIKEKKKKSQNAEKVDEIPLSIPPSPSQNEKELAKTEQTEIVRSANIPQVLKVIPDPSNHSIEKTVILPSPPDKKISSPIQPMKNNLKAIKRYAFLILFFLMIGFGLIIVGFQNPTISIFIILLFLVIEIVLLYLDLRLLFDVKDFKVEIPEPEKKLDRNTINFIIREAFPFYPYSHFTHVRFFKKAFQFTECIIISPLAFFDSFKFSKGMIRFNDYFYEAVVSPCVMEWVGDIEDRFPLLNTKFCTGLVGKDEQVGLSFNLIENAKLQTYYRIMCEARADSSVKDNRITDLESMQQTLKMNYAKSKQRYSADTDLIANMTQKENIANIQMQANVIQPRKKASKKEIPQMVWIGLTAGLVLLIIILGIL